MICGDSLSIVSWSCCSVRDKGLLSWMRSHYMQAALFFARASRKRDRNIFDLSCYPVALAYSDTPYQDKLPFRLDDSILRHRLLNTTIP